jgi:hypothetical protein
MAFTVFTNSTTAVASEVNDNFYFVAQGNRLPRTGNSLTETTGVYDVGSATYKWNTLFTNSLSCANLNISGSITSEYMLGPEYLYEELSCASSRIEITGLNGESCDAYEVYVNISAYKPLYIWPNGDSNVANYGSQRLVVDYSTTSALVTNTSGNTASCIYCSLAGRVKSIIHPKNENSRIVQTIFYGDDLYKPAWSTPSTYRYFYKNQSTSWSNDSDTLTSLVFQTSAWPPFAAIKIAVWKKLNDV